MKRTPVLTTIARLLDDAPPDRAGWPRGYSHRAMARVVYGTGEPTAAQLAAVRRAVLRLVDGGRAVRSESRDRPAWEEAREAKEGAIRHHRRVGGYRHECRNPVGLIFWRTLTAADHELIEARRPEEAARYAVMLAGMAAVGESVRE